MSKVHIAPMYNYITLCGIGRRNNLKIDSGLAKSGYIPKKVTFKKATCKSCIKVWKRQRKLIEKYAFGKWKNISYEEIGKQLKRQNK